MPEPLDLEAMRKRHDRAMKARACDMGYQDWCELCWISSKDVPALVAEVERLCALAGALNCRKDGP